jgi:uncharacterized membrane protein YbhN (UPF0104 family)
VANVGLANLVDEFKGADLGWLAAATLISPIYPIAQTVATLGASFRPLRFGPVLMLEYAIQFIALAVPSSAARLALDVRFFGRNGIEGGAALSIGVIASVSGFVTQIALVLVISLSGLASLDLGRRDATTTSAASDSSSSGGHRLLILVNTLSSLFAGFMPVPGGMGVAEAAYTAGLVALGVPDAPAMSTAIAFRMVTYFLPPLWGAVAIRWLRQHAYL